MGVCRFLLGSEKCLIDVQPTTTYDLKSFGLMTIAVTLIHTGSHTHTHIHAHYFEINILMSVLTAKLGDSLKSVGLRSC